MSSDENGVFGLMKKESVLSKLVFQHCRAYKLD